MGKTKIWIITAAVFVLAGALIFAGVMTMLKWDFTKLSTVKYETNVHEIDKVFDSISIDTDNSNLWIHNNDFYYGSAGGDKDQAKGDGSLDIKKSKYITYIKD